MTKLDPYILGIWLSEGSRDVITTTQENVRMYLKSKGCTFKKDGKSVYIKEAKKELVELGLYECKSDSKFIPKEFKYETIPNRKALLAGIIDGDGECTKTGSVIYSSTSKALIDDVTFLARSLGYKVHEPISKIGKYTKNGEIHECKKCYRITIAAHENPFRYSTHKLTRWKRPEDRYLKRWIESIEYIGEKDGMCVQVDNPTGLYLANDFIVTHNSTFESWLIFWFLSCWKHGKMGCTAPSAEQMFDVLWAEASLWLNKMPEKLRENYDWQSSYIRIKEDPEAWFARARTARKEKPEALAGLHAPHVGILVDEASGVEDIIFKTAHGALTNKNTLVFMISNGTRNIGYFYDSHHKDKEDWQCLSFNSLESPIVDEKFVNLIRNKYGEGSDEWRIRVEGKFADEGSIDDSGYMQLITENDLRYIHDADFDVGWKKMGVDPSGMGNNKTIITIRDTFKAMVVYEEKKSTPEKIAAAVVQIAKTYDISPEDIFMDVFGVGAEAYQKLALAGFDVVGVDVAGKADDDEKFANIRAEAYWRTRTWLRTGGDLVQNEGYNDLKSIKYKKTVGGKIQIMPKKEMLKAGYASPDYADSLMLTCCQPDTERDDYEESFDDSFAGELG